MKKKLAFKVGQKVDFSLAGVVHFTGTIKFTVNSRFYKPYTIETEDGETKYAHEHFLSLHTTKEQTS